MDGELFFLYHRSGGVWRIEKTPTCDIQRPDYAGAAMTGRPTASLGMVTTKDVARVVGVSASTVARALRDNPRISEQTRLRVRDAAREMGYVVHSAARLMRGESSTVIGLAVPDIQNDFYATLARAVAEVCRESGFQLVLSITEDDPDAESEHLRAMVGAQVAGTVIVPTAKPLPASLALLDRLPSTQVIRHVSSIDSDWFAIDDERGVYEATKHLIDGGHQRIAYVGASDQLSTGQARLDGYRSAHARAGLHVRPELIALGSPRVDFARAALTALYATFRPTAIVSGGSQITVGILQALSDLGIRIPEDMSFVAYGDSALYRSWPTPLTAIALPVRDIALAGCTSLIRRIRGGRQVDVHEPAPHRALYLPRLVVRRSTTRPAFNEDPAIAGT